MLLRGWLSDFKHCTCHKVAVIQLKNWTHFTFQTLFMVF